MELDNLLNELKNNNLLYRQLLKVQEDLVTLKRLCVETNTYIVYNTNQLEKNIKDYFSYSLFLVDKIICLTEMNGKNIYNRQELINLF